MTKYFVNVGFNNIINSDKIIAIICADSAPCKKLIQNRRELGNVIDCTGGRKTKSVIVTSEKHILLCAISSTTLASRLNGIKKENEDK